MPQHGSDSDTDVPDIQQGQVSWQEVHGDMRFGFDEDGRQDAEISIYSSYISEKEDEEQACAEELKSLLDPAGQIPW